MPNPLARAMRKRMTDAEMGLWYRLRPMRRSGLAFRRQSALGDYIIDFECRRARLCVEVDGAQHGLANALEYDAMRTAWLESQGYKVLRYWNHEVIKNTDVVVDQILEIARARAAERAAE